MDEYEVAPVAACSSIANTISISTGHRCWGGCFLSYPLATGMSDCGEMNFEGPNLINTDDILPGKEGRVDARFPLVAPQASISAFCFLFSLAVEKLVDASIRDALNMLGRRRSQWP